MMFPESFPLLLIVLVFSSSSGSSEVLINVPAQETKPEGSCVTISCTYKPGADQHFTLLWFKDAVYDSSMKKYTGTILYSNTDERPQSPGYSSRVEYITDIRNIHRQTDPWIKCDLRINDLQKTDSGNYNFRFIGLDSKIKYMSTSMNLKVTDNPCKVNMARSDLNISVKESDEITVHCSTSGSCSSFPEFVLHKPGPKPETVTSSTNWITHEEEGKEGKKITKLNFISTWKDDNMILSCRPKGSQDSCLMKNVTLSVEYAPKEVKAAVSSENVKEGDSVTLSCSARARPNVTVSWFRDEREMSQLVEWTLKDVKPETSGEYYCQAKNKHGHQKSEIISINVKYGPKGVSVTPDVNISNLKEGDELKLTCSVKDSNPAVNEFTWYLNNSLLPQQTSKTLTIRAVTPEHKGYYHCTANNGVNTVQSESLHVPVMYSPHQIKIHGETSVKVGRKLTLTCSADANPPPDSYTWTHTPGMTSEALPLSFSETTGTLNIEKMTLKHTGKYTCAVTNVIGTRKESKEVNVLYPPSKLELNITSKAREYEVISITCTVQSFPQSQLTVTGRSDLKSIDKNRVNITESNNKITSYLNVTEADAGVYSCAATNSEGTNHTEKTLKVLHVPKNVSISSEGEQMEGHKLTLACNARSEPTPSSYKWKNLISGELKTSQNLQKLHFKSLQITDSGQYICIAGNDIGKAESLPIDIRVKYCPNIKLIHNMTAQGNWEHPVYLTCSADAYPPPREFSWYHLENKTVLSHQQNFTVGPQNPGIYYCAATNDVGSSQSEHIKLFVRSSFAVFCQIFLPIFLLLILIALAIYLIRRSIIKGSQNNNNLSLEDVTESCRERVTALHPEDPQRTQIPCARPDSNTQQLYSVVKGPQLKQGGHCPKQQESDNMESSSINYATLEFKGTNEPTKRAPKGSDSAIYAKVTKNKQSKHSEPEQPDYENISSACAPKLPIFTNMEWESDTSEEDEVNYTTVSCTAKADGLREPKPKRSFGNSSSNEGDRTEYSAIKI